MTYDKDLDSLLMALFFGAAMLCYATSIYLLMRAPEAGTALRLAAPRPGDQIPHPGSS